MKQELGQRTVEEAYADLAGAICEQAYKDLKSAYRKYELDPKGYAGEVIILERFFRGEWFTFLIGGTIDGETVIKEARKRCKTSRHI